MTAQREQRRLLVPIRAQRLRAGDIGTVMAADKDAKWYTLRFNSRFVTVSADKVSDPIADGAAW